MTEITSRGQGTSEGQYVHANGIDIHYVEAGVGEPLLLLYNGMISTSAVWTDWPSSYAKYFGTSGSSPRTSAVRA